MATTYRDRNLTVDEVYAEFREHFLKYGLDFESDAPKVCIDMTMGEVFELSDYEIDWVGGLTYSIGLSMPENWWKQWEFPMRTVREFCDDVANRITVPELEPITILGKRCETAGMFLMMKQLLAESGIDTCEMAPSTPIKSYARQNPHFFCRMRIAKRGRLPEPRFNSWANGCLAGICVGFSVAMFVYFTGRLLPLAILLGIVSAYCAALFVGGFLNPYNRIAVRFPGIVTFRDFIHAAFDKPIRQKA